MGLGLENYENGRMIYSYWMAGSNLPTQRDLHQQSSRSKKRPAWWPTAERDSRYSPWMGPQTADEWELAGDIMGATELFGLAQLGDLISLGANLYKGDNAGIMLSLAAFAPGGSQVKLGVKGVGNIAKNAKKMSADDIGKFLGAGKDWHKTSAKSKFLNKFKKELKGDTNADFYIDKATKEVFLKSNKSGNWVNTGQKF